jgi:GNAT superfamily N-acetyltransferase
MQGLAQRITAASPDMISAGASYGELAWIWGKGHAAIGSSWVRRLWFAGGDMVAWGWVTLPYEMRRTDGSIRAATGAGLCYQIHPDHTDLVDEIADWYADVATGLERTLTPTNAEEHALRRWAAHGYVSDEAELADDGSWTQLNQRDLADIETPVVPEGFRIRTAGEAGPAAAVQAHVDAWAPSTYTAEAYRGVAATKAYRDDLHILVEAPNGTMAASAIMWFDEVNRTVEFEPVGTHPDYRRLGLGRTMMLAALHRARSAGATHATVVCLGAPGHPRARGLYSGLGFRELSRDVPLIKPAD